MSLERKNAINNQKLHVSIHLQALQGGQCLECTLVNVCDQVLGQLEHLQRKQIPKRMDVDLRDGIVGQIQFPEVCHVHEVTRVYTLDVVLREIPVKRGGRKGK